MTKQEAIMVNPVFQKYAEELKEEMKNRIMTCSKEDVERIRNDYVFLNRIATDIQNLTY